MIKHDLFKLLIDLLLFPQDYITLSLNGLGLEFRVLQDIGEYVDCSRDIGVKGLGIVDGVFTLYVNVSACFTRGREKITEVYAFKWPPMFSISSSNCCCVRFLVPYARL